MEIVGLKNFVPDDVNKIICKFVGVKPHPLARLLMTAEEDFCYTVSLGFLKKVRFIQYFLKELRRLNQIKSIPKRREAFLKLREWERIYLILFYARDLFPMNRKNLRFLKDELCNLGFKTWAIDWYDFEIRRQVWYDELN